MLVASRVILLQLLCSQTKSIFHNHTDRIAYKSLFFCMLHTTRSSNYSLSGFRIGFENITYTVDEGIGSFMVCVRMFEPPPGTVIGLTINLAVETFTGTAGE